MKPYALFVFYALTIFLPALAMLRVVLIWTGVLT